MNSRGQVTLFIILGIVAVLVAGIYYATSSKSKASLLQASAKTTFSEVQDSANMFVTECLKKTSILAVHEYGLDSSFSPERMKRYVESHLKECTQRFEDFKRIGYEVTEGALSSVVIMNDNTVQVELTFPIVFKKGNIEFEIKDFKYTLDRAVSERLNPGGDTLLQSSDGSMRIRIPEGTKVYVGDKETDTIGIRLLDKHFEGLSNSVVPGMVVFEGVPDGATFSKEVELTIWYDDRDINPTFPEEDIRIGYYDRSRGIWWGLPTEVDTEKNQLTIKTTHFSPYATSVHCSPGEQQDYTIPNPLVKNDAMACDDWTTESIGQTSPHLPAALWTANVPHTKGSGTANTVYDPDASAQYMVARNVWAERDLDGSSGNCKKCEECEFTIEGPNGGADIIDTKRCVGGCGDDDSPDCGGEECTSGFDYKCGEVYYYDTDTIVGSASYIVYLRGDGNTCVPTEHELIEKAAEALGESDGNDGVGTDGISILPVCNVGECKIVDSDRQTGSNDAYMRDSDYDYSPDLNRNSEGAPLVSFSIKARNVPAATRACFEATATVSMKGIGLKEGDYYCTKEQDGELTFIHDQCMACAPLNDPDRGTYYKYVPETDCDNICTHGLVGTTRLTEDECQMCTLTNGKYQYMKTDMGHCAKCTDVFNENPKLPRCNDARNS